MLRGKIVVVGAGFVGSTTAYTIMLDGFFREIVLIDVNKDKADGDALDMAHGTSFLKPVSVYSGDWKALCRRRYSRYNSRGKPKSRRNTN